MKEYLLSTNKFLEPDVLKDSDAYGTLITRLLLLEPGTNPLHPGMGVGLGPKYRYLSESDIADLQTKIQEQIETYLPSEFLSVVEVYLEIKTTKYLVITITADNTKYIFDTENSDTPIQISDII